MSAPNIVIDGAAPYGTGAAVSINGVAYKLNNLNVERPETKAMRRNTDGRPQDQRWTADVATLAAEAQLATSATAYPAFGMTFTLTVDANYGSETWVVMPQNYVATNGEGDIRVVPIRAEKVLNGSVTTVA